MDNKPDESLFSINHTPVVNVDPGKSLSITISIESEHPIKWVHLMHRPVNQEYEYERFPMKKVNDNSFEVAISPGKIDVQWDYMYYFEIMDKKGNGIIYPDLNKETPYIFVKINREQEM